MNHRESLVRASLWGASLCRRLREEKKQIRAFKASIAERAECYGTVMRRAATRRAGRDRRTSDLKEKENKQKQKQSNLFLYWSM